MKRYPPPPCKHNFQPTVPMLINEISRLFNERMRVTTTEPLQTQHSCRVLLSALVHMEGCTQLDLVNATLLKAPTVSISLKKLEESGFVRRETNRDDMRAIRVYLTDKGKELNLSTRERFRVTDEIIQQGISEEEKEYLLKTLTKMRDNILESLQGENKQTNEID
ncbi:MAG: winged helix-turn-helix transcriptional regulator [Clostridia bacterium]|nr:winged helix-turn-helix transcriptional regulator [Clostridia bacterium]